MDKIKVENITSDRGNKIANQFIIHTEEAKYFQSYDSIIAMYDYNKRKWFLDEKYWDYSRTTSKYRNLVIGIDTKTTKQRIADGTYELVNLN